MTVIQAPLLFLCLSSCTITIPCSLSNCNSGNDCCQDCTFGGLDTYICIVSIGSTVAGKLLGCFLFPSDTGIFPSDTGMPILLPNQNVLPCTLTQSTVIMLHVLLPVCCTHVFFVGFSEICLSIVSKSYPPPLSSGVCACVRARARACVRMHTRVAGGKAIKRLTILKCNMQAMQGSRSAAGPAGRSAGPDLGLSGYQEPRSRPPDLPGASACHSLR